LKSLQKCEFPGNLNLSRRKSQNGINELTVQDGGYGVEDPGRHITGNYMHIIIK